MIRRFLLGLCLLGLIAVTVPACTGQYDLVILAGKLIDGTGSPAQHDVTITVRDGRITSITPLWGGAPRARRVIDARDATVLPGLINACARVDFWSEDGGHAWSHHGVTTVVDVGSSTEEIARHRQAFSAEDSPRLVVTGPAVITPGHQFAHLTDPPDRICVVIDPPEATRRIEQLMAQPAPDIVLAGRPWRELPPEPVLAAVVEQAHTGERMVMVWADTPDEFGLAVEAGADTVLFVPNAIDDGWLERAVERRLILVPVLSTVCEMYPGQRADIVATVRRFHELGGQLAVGDDAGRWKLSAGLPLGELELLQREVGLTNLEVIAAATSGSAAAAGLGQQLGTVEPGKAADLIVVLGDPETDLTDLVNVSIVIRDGRVIHERTTTPVPLPSAEVRAVTADRLILAGRLIDGTGRRSVSDIAIAIHDGAISGLYPASQVKACPETEVIDARDCTVLPGLINAHVHLMHVVDRRRWIPAGVTMMYDLGAARLELLKYFRERAIGPDRPTILMAGPTLTPVGGHPAKNDQWTLRQWVTGPEDAAQRAAELIDVHGVDFIKIAITDNFGRLPRMSEEEARAIVEVAHSRGRRVFAHVESAEEIRIALDVNVDVLAHAALGYIPDSLHREAIERDVTMVPTLSYMVGHSLGNWAMGGTRRFFQLGGRIALGDDMPVPGTVPQGLPQAELLLLEECGLSGLDIITAATGNAAYVAGLTTVGTIEQGMIADLVIVRGDPAQDISLLGQVRMVLREGQIVFHDDSR